MVIALPPRKTTDTLHSHITNCITAHSSNKSINHMLPVHTGHAGTAFAFNISKMITNQVFKKTGME